MSILWNPSLPVWNFVLRGGVVYAAVLLLLRLGGKRQIGQMGAGEFVAILLISNAVQNAMNGGDNSITGGLVLALVLVLMSAGVAWLTYRSRKWEVFLQGRPTLLVHQGKILHDNLKRELMNEHELRILLRRQGFHQIEEIQEAVLESNGWVSVIRSQGVLHPGGDQRPA